MINAVIIDDEQHCIDRLKDLLIQNQALSVQLKGAARTVNEGIKQISVLQPDLVFLDVQIGDKTGFDLLRD
ncbi:MAG TPA: response regulator [Hanamia sp.]|nr:response regulator [Hanamia sp.]